MNGTLVEFEVGLGFFDNFGEHLGSAVWYIVADNIEEAEEALDKFVWKRMETYGNGEVQVVDYSHDWLSMCRVHPSTWEHEGAVVAL